MPTLTGITRDSVGAALGGVTVNAFNASNDTLAATGTSDSQGAYSLSVAGAGPFYVVGHKPGTTFLAGTTRRDLASVADAGPAATVQNLWTGVPTADGVMLSAKMNSTGNASSTRIAVSTSSDLSSPTYSSAVAPDSTYRIAKHTITGKQPNTEYWYAVEVDGTIDPATKGRFKTLPASAASFKVILGACANGASLPSINAINAITPKPLMAIFLGDVHYGADNDTLHNVAEQMVDMDNTLSTPARAQLHREIPTMAMYDDHDYLGNDQTGRDASNIAVAGRQGPLDFYRLRMPMPFASSVATDTCHYSHVIGRVRFVVSDLRADKTKEGTADSASKTMMGAAQKTWFKGQIDAAASAGQYVCWISTVPWFGGVSNSSNNWGGYNTERVELANYIKSQGMEGKICVIAGDAHSLGISYGTSQAATGNMVMPSFQVGPLGASAASDKTGPLDQGPFPAVGTPANNFGIMDVIDDGTNMTIHWTGIDALNSKEWAYWNFTPFGTYLADPSKTVPSAMVAPVASTGIQSAVVAITPLDAGSTGGAPVLGYTVVSIPAGGVDANADTLATNHTMTGLTPGVSYTFKSVARNRVGTSAQSPASNAVTPTSEATPAGIFNATGGTITEDATHKYWTFLASDSLNVTSEGPVEYVIVGGGGAGSSGTSSSTRPGGGGAGGFKQGSITLAVQTLAVTVGAGGIGATNGVGTVGGASSLGSLVSVLGGGRGSASSPTTNPAGGSGGGAAGRNSAGTFIVQGLGTAGQGNDGGTGYGSVTVAEIAGGGGGGAGSAGQNATLGQGGNGGAGVTVWGRTLAGGGGGSGGTEGGSGAAGGGNAPKASGAIATSAAANTGSGGGAAAVGGRSGDGGSGIVILRRAK